MSDIAPLDITSFTTPRERLQLYAYMATRKRHDRRGNSRVFIAQALTDSVPLDREWMLSERSAETSAADELDELVYDRHVARVRILGEYNDGMDPHSYLPNPCDEATAADSAAAASSVVLYTLGVTSRGFAGYSTDGHSILAGDILKLSCRTDKRGKTNTEQGVILETVARPADFSATTESEYSECTSLADLSWEIGTTTSRTSAGRRGSAGERRTINFESIKHSAGCSPSNRSSTDFATYLGTTSYNNWIVSLKAHEAGSYSTVNSAGYLGYYQFGVAALETVGFLAAGSQAILEAAGCGGQSVSCRSVTDTVLNDTSKWSGTKAVELGVSSKEDYLANKNNAQDIAVGLFSSISFRSLSSSGDLDLSNPNDVGGMIATAHLRGVGGARDMRRGTEHADGYGMFPSTYYIEIGAAVC